MKKFWIAALIAIREQEVFLKTEGYLAESKEEASFVAHQSCYFIFPIEDGFGNHLTSVGEVPVEQLKAIVSGKEYDAGHGMADLISS